MKKKINGYGEEILPERWFNLLFRWSWKWYWKSWLYWKMIELFEWVRNYSKEKNVFVWFIFNDSNCKRQKWLHLALSNWILKVVFRLKTLAFEFEGEKLWRFQLENKHSIIWIARVLEKKYRYWMWESIPFWFFLSSTINILSLIRRYISFTFS